MPSHFHVEKVPTARRGQQTRKHTGGCPWSIEKRNDANLQQDACAKERNGGNSRYPCDIKLKPLLDERN